MGQKVNPISLRLQKTNRHFDSSWYDDYNYTHLLLQDLKIKNYYKTVLDQIKYPESRVINLGVPKKTISNLFYYNPSNSRRKKSVKFQLQNFKEKTSKNKKGFFQQKINQEKVYSFFDFPKQQYWKNNTFTLALQQIEQVTPHIWRSDKNSNPLSKHPDLNEMRSEKNQSDFLFHTAFTETLFTSPKVLYCAQGVKSSRLESNLFSFNKKISPSLLGPKMVLKDDDKIKSNVLLPSNTSYGTESCVRSPSKGSTVKGTMMSTLTKKKEEVICCARSAQGVKSPKIYCDKKKSEDGIDKLLLEFVMKKNNNSTSSPSRCDGGNSSIQRFFVRYLLAQLYCNYLQNKDNYNKESITTLSRFLVFFQEKNVKNGVFLKKRRLFKSLRKKPSIANHITSHHTEKSILILPSSPTTEEMTAEDRNTKEGTTKDGVMICSNNANNYFPEGEIMIPFSSEKIEALSSPKEIHLGNKGSRSDVRSCKDTFFQSTKNNLFDITRSDVKKKKNSPLYNRSGVYNSNTVYKSHLEGSLSKHCSSLFTVHLFRTLIEKQSAFFWVQEIIYYLERKIPFRRIQTDLLKSIPHYKHIKGIRIKCSGRVGGRSKKAQRSKTQSVKMGQTSLGMFDSKIDFACKSASTRFGLIGVKVWVCYK